MVGKFEEIIGIALALMIYVIAIPILAVGFVVIESFRKSLTLLKRLINIKAQ